MSGAAARTGSLIERTEKRIYKKIGWGIYSNH